MEVNRKMKVEVPFRQELPPSLSGDSQPAPAQHEVQLDKDKQRFSEEDVERLNRILEQTNSSVSFRVRTEDGRTIVQLVEKNGERVLYQLPPEGLVELSKKVKEAVGRIIDLQL
ncbi:flagellar protein FlaG [Brevibacillus centrosporus]|uniref:flagellar protein FlaG n=1 Tax=Brevibacillus centrosporus TaxID=54910 RepID=UPI002E1C8FB7|nr:flagellar protein FlaG [Brevibacillus centrosporus]